ncbi:MAG: hypothetical protein P1U32_06400 [Legionellaceae bacterium]|nr:hypothetical protein [Legionellaceae bacterium]
MASFSSEQKQELIGRVDTLFKQESAFLKAEAAEKGIDQEKIDNVFEGDASPYSVLQKTVRDAVVIYADSSATLQDALHLEKVVNEAVDTFVGAAHEEMTQHAQRIYAVLHLQGRWNRAIFQGAFIPSEHDKYVRGGGFQEEMSNKVREWVGKIADKLDIKPDALKKIQDEFFKNELKRYLEAFISKEYGISKHADESDKDFSERVSQVMDAKQRPIHVHLEKSLAFLSEKHANDVHPLALLMFSAQIAGVKYAANGGDKAAHEALKKDIDVATDACVARYKGKVDPATLDYVKAAGLFIVGVIVSLATFYALPYKPYRDFVKSTFFSPVESKVVDTKESQAAQEAAVEGKLADTLDEACSYRPQF